MSKDTGAPASGTGSHPTGQAPTGLGASRFDPSRAWRKARQAWYWAVARFGPYAIVWIGAGVAHISGGQFVPLCIAGILFAWAVSLAHEHGRNKVGADYALSIAALLRDGYGEIVVTQKHVYAADKASLDALQKAIAQHRDSDGSPEGGDGEAGSVRSTTARAEGIAQNLAPSPIGEGK